MADLSRTIAAKLRISSEGEPEIFGKTANELEKMRDAAKSADSAADGLGKAYETASKAVAEGSSRAGTAVEKLKVTIDNYKRAIEEAEKAGQHVGDGQRQEVARLEAEYQKLTASAGKLATSQQQAKRATDDATEAAGGQAQRINGLDDIVNKLAEDLGPGAVKWISWGAAAAGAFTAGWEAGKKLNQVLDQLTDGQVSRNIQDVWVRQLHQLGIELDGDSHQAEILKNELHALAKNGIDVAGLSAEQVHEKFQQLTHTLDDHRKAVLGTAGEYEKWAKSIGPVGKDLDDLAKKTASFVERFANDHKELSQLQLSKVLGPDVDKLIAEFEKAGQKVPPELKRIADSWKLLADETKISVDKQLTAIGLVYDKLMAAKPQIQAYVDAFRAAGQEVPALLAQQADAVGIFVHELERVPIGVNMMTGEVTGGAEALAVLDARMKASASSAKDFENAAFHLAQVLEGLGTTAAGVGDKVKSIFDMTGGNEGPYGSPLGDNAYGSPLTNPYGTPLSPGQGVDGGGGFG